MTVDDRMGPVGTRGGVEWMRGPCACPHWGATGLLHEVPTGSRCHQDKHKAPTLPLIRPLSLQDPFGRQQSSGVQMNLSKCIIGGVHEALIRAPLR